MSTSNARRTRRNADKEAALVTEAASVLANRANTHAVNLATRNVAKDLPDTCRSIRRTSLAHSGGRSVRFDTTIVEVYGVHPKLPPLTGKDASGKSFYAWYKAYNDANDALEVAREAARPVPMRGESRARLIREEQLESARATFRKESEAAGGADWWDVPPTAYASPRAAMDAVANKASK